MHSFYLIAEFQKVHYGQRTNSWQTKEMKKKKKPNKSKTHKTQMYKIVCLFSFFVYVVKSIKCWKIIIINKREKKATYMKIYSNETSTFIFCVKIHLIEQKKEKIPDRKFRELECYSKNDLHWRSRKHANEIVHFFKKPHKILSWLKFEMF